ncbi:glutamic acid-rich protein-like [Saccostrea echinata]|uniref:glutamic acid-rich protein-like n=1 Tax=Saccostrea echinata TaxID=191078 RepID=UPI002A7F8583|nr:glutamic acid-rich protein-like [Saccostrea echinata]
MTSMNDAARTLKHTSQGSRAGTKQQTRGSVRPHGESQSDDRHPVQNQTDNQSRQRSNQNQNLNQSRQRSQPEPYINQSRQRTQPEPNINQSRQRTQPEPNLNQSRQRSQPEPNLNQSRQRSQPEPNLNQSRQRTQPEPNLNQSRQRSQPESNLNQSRQRTQPEPNLNQSRQRSRGYDEDYENNNRSRQRSQQDLIQADPRSRERTQDGHRSVLQTQDRNRSVIQSPGGWSNREENVPQRNLSQQAVTPRSQRPSQQGRISARPSQTGGSRRSLGPTSQQADNEYDEEEEDEDDVSEDNSFVDYYPEYAPPPSAKPKGPRAETADDYETCSCFPRRKNKNIPSMLYENITCVHTGLKGQSHAGVFRFEDNWIERDVQTAPKEKGNEKKNKKKERIIARPKMKYVYGYPKPVLPAFSDDEEEDDQDDDDYDEDIISEDDDIDAVSTKSKPPLHSRNSKSKSNKKKKQQKKDDNDTGVEEMDDDDFDDEEEEDEPQEMITREEAYYPVMLPQIGHSPPPSRERSRLSARSQPALPPLPESPFMTTHKDKKKLSIKPTQSFRSEQRELPATRESGRHSAPDIRKSPSPRTQKPIMKTRRFQGVYFDPVRKRAVPYDISWNGHLEQNDGRMSSRMPSRMRSGSRYSKADIPEEEDYYDDEGYEEDPGTTGHR